MGKAKAKHQAPPTDQLKIYVRAVIEYEAWPIVVQAKFAYESCLQ